MNSWKHSALPLVFLILGGGAIQAQQASRKTPTTAAEAVDYAKEIKPILAQHCIDCHGLEEPKAMLRLDNLDPTFAGASAESWHDVLNRLTTGEMPPDDQPPIDTVSRRKLANWIRHNLDRVALERRGDQRQTVLRRLTRYEYNNTLRDLLGIDSNFARDLPPEPSSADGFKNNGASLGISALQIEYYLEAARQALDKAIVEGPAPQVHKHRFEKSSAGSGRNQTIVGKRMLPEGQFFGKMMEYPREGEFSIRVMAGSSVPEGMGLPRMQVSLGMRSDTQSPSKIVGVRDVPNSELEKKLYEFRGRMEEFPLPGHNPKFPGMTIAVTNAYEDGLKTPKPRKYKAIGLNGEQKKEVNRALAENTPTLPIPKEKKKGNKSVATLLSTIGKLQRQLEEMRVLEPDNPNKTDLAYRKFDIEQAIDREPSLIAQLAKEIEEDPNELLGLYQSTNASLLADRKSVLSRFNEIPSIDRKTKKFAEEEPKQPPRTTLVIDYLEFEGPLYDAWPPEHHTNLLPPSNANERDRAETAISSFMARAYRRPIQQSDVIPVLSIYDEIRPNSPSFEEAMRECLAMVLISPEFLYLVEPTETASRPLSQHEFASRLSYFLWSTMPDESLRMMADTGQLNNPTAIEKQVRSMIADSRALNFVEHFTNQWLDLSGLDRVAINPNDYPDFDDRLKAMMKEETHAFFAEILRQNLSALNLIDSDFLMINEPLAKHYGLTNPDGSPKGGNFERVTLPTEDQRGGLLTQSSFLMINSNGEDSHPIRRAVWILDRILGDPPAPPPPDVPELNSEQPDFASLTLKEQLEIHRTKSACNDCHRTIDPWGIAFESYDAVGLQREFVRRRVGQKTVKAEVDDQATLPNGTKIVGVEGLKRYLLQNERERFSRSLVSKLLAYGLGRSLVLEDRPTIESLVKSFRDNDYRLGDLIVAITQSVAFQEK